MACYSQTSTQIKLIFQSGSFHVTSLQLPGQNPISTLYFDKYFYLDDGELPIPYHDHIIGFLYEDESTSNFLKCHFYNTLSSLKTIYRAFEENPGHVIYILCDDMNPVTRFLIISYNFSELFNMNIFLTSFSAFKAEEIMQQYVFNNWVENYEKCLSEWLNYSEFQRAKISEMTQELKAVKEAENLAKNKQKRSEFGECLLCCDNPKSIVYIPCGHIVACYNCTVKCMKIELNRKINKKRTQKLCPLCNGPIFKAMEVSN